MSVFTFMGSGLLKKDNDLTLGIIEETLNVLFTAVMSDNVRIFFSVFYFLHVYEADFFKFTCECCNSLFS